MGGGVAFDIAFDAGFTPILTPAFAGAGSSPIEGEGIYGIVAYSW